MNEDRPLTLDYDAFARIWQALVSKRKARRLRIDREQAWAQLAADGARAQFLRTESDRRAAKKNKSLDGAAKIAKPRKAAKKTARKASAKKRSATARRGSTAARKKPAAKRARHAAA